MSKYPKYIMDKLLERVSLEEIKILSKHEVFEEVCEYEGLINYSNTIRLWIKDIYDIEL